MAEEVKETVTVEETTETTEETVKEVKKEKKEKKEKKNKQEEEIKKLTEELANFKNEYLKVFAEMENTKKRLKEETIRDRKYASQKVIGELIGPIDMLVQIVNMPAPSPEIQNYVIGFQMIANQLIEILKNEGLAPINVTLGSDFDPKVMEAFQIEETLDSENKVLKVVQPGYMYKDRILRPAMVVVSKIKEKKEEE